jgi:hypothetical protein
MTGGIYGRICRCFRRIVSGGICMRCFILCHATGIIILILKAMSAGAGMRCLIILRDGCGYGRRWELAMLMLRWWRWACWERFFAVVCLCSAMQKRLAGYLQALRWCRRRFYSSSSGLIVRSWCSPCWRRRVFYMIADIW